MRFAKQTACALALALTTVALAGPARAADPAALVAAKRALQAGVNRADVPTLLEARAQFEALSNAEPDSKALHNWVAVADWRVVPILRNREKGLEQARHYAEDGLTHCDAALQLDPRFSEALALKAGLQGMMIGFDPSSAMTLGPESMRNLRQATASDSGNPRVWLMEGINTLHKPVPFGGGADKALPELLKTEQLFAAEPAADSLACDWGHDDASFWAGQAAMELKQYALARAHYRQALAINPGFGWARLRLADAEKELNKAGQEPKKEKS